ncbi:hypothetical protein R69619_00796 [Paraburkholderia nemoris]|jgi:hypothetical protein|uniref:Uncharacterized protein n=1 Tax=Paraburkholderia aspalathi TaxID=1324617 RepID=A0A1I7EIQ8_9BURK|nr:hypothetical protein R69746_00714 [Paraburkholderia aspalathi]CAE6704301.1 hypothetical protein R69619_00796 [Paraburkholderia nemoris]SOE99825.1 hypothetical protein SAMN05446635_7863 [Burkholderia sp. OK233]CAE6751159.1 hypothetical protein LMG22931_03145 [Paraburkholderia nemoris]CAE6828865.1 hypothetical protein R75465_06174 [Paraburkholderia aspalathi]
MRKLMTILAFLAGGLAAELAHPVHCSLINVNRVRVNRRKD